MTTKNIDAMGKRALVWIFSMLGLQHKAKLA
jgi:hypothetical protein